MGIYYIKGGNQVTIHYTGKGLDTGLTVQGTAYDESGTVYSAGQPFAFTHQVNGVYVATLTSQTGTGWHTVHIDATDPGKSSPAVFKFRVANNSIQEIYNLVATVDGKIDSLTTSVNELKGAGFNTATDSNEAVRNFLDSMAGASFNTSTDSQEAIRNAIDAIATAVAGIQGVVRTYLTAPGEFVIPSSGTTRYQVDLQNYANDGTGMEDFDAAPTMVAVGSNGTTYTTRFYNAATAGTQTNTMVQVGGAGSGHYRTWFEVDNADPADVVLVFTAQAVENGNNLSVIAHSTLKDSASAAGTAQQSTLLESLSTTSGTYDRDTDSQEAIRDRLDQVVLEIKQTTAGTYDRDTDSLEAISDKVTAARASVEGVGFATGTDSLKAISDRQLSFLGVGFNATTDSLAALSDSVEEILTFNSGGRAF